MFAVQSGIQLRFPSVKHITTQQLHSWLHTSDNDPPIDVMLLDIREEQEYQISHITGAVRAGPEMSDFRPIYESIKALASKSENYVIVAYCSVGYRSAAFVDKVQRYISDAQDNKTYNIYNLEGSIFKWANEGRNMVDKSNNITPFVHPYNFVWGKLVSSKLRKYDNEL